MVYITKKNAKIFYELYGDGDECITLINGYTRTSSDFKLLGSSLAERGFKILTFDNRGSGKTETVLDFTIEDIVGDVVDLWNALEISRSHVLGISMGGFIAQVLAVHEQKRISSLCLISSSANSKIFSVNIEWSKNEDKVFEQLKKYFHAEYISKNKVLIQAMAKHIVKENAQGEFEKKAKSQRNAIQKTPFDETALHSLNVPTLILHGQEDAVIPVSEGQKLQKLIPNAQLHIYEQSGHMLLVEERKDMYSRVADFFSKQ